jgi:hypothetical protein
MRKQNEALRQSAVIWKTLLSRGLTIILERRDVRNLNVTQSDTLMHTVLYDMTDNSRLSPDKVRWASRRVGNSMNCFRGQLRDFSSFFDVYFNDRCPRRVSH